MKAWLALRLVRAAVFLTDEGCQLTLICVGALFTVFFKKDKLTQDINPWKSKALYGIGMPGVSANTSVSTTENECW